VLRHGPTHLALFARLQDHFVAFSAYRWTGSLILHSIYSHIVDCRCVPGIWTLIAVRGIWLCANARYFVETGWVSLSHLQACRSTYKLLKFWCGLFFTVSELWSMHTAYSFCFPLRTTWSGDCSCVLFGIFISCGKHNSLRAHVWLGWARLYLRTEPSQANPRGPYLAVQLLAFPPTGTSNQHHATDPPAHSCLRNGENSMSELTGKWSPENWTQWNTWVWCCPIGNSRTNFSFYYPFIYLTIITSTERKA
jgi:hypothetical protein